MDILSLFGLLLGIGAILGGNMIDGGQTRSLLQVTAFVIVFGGTVGAILLQTPLKVFLRALRIAKWVFMPPKLVPVAVIEKIVGWSQIARKEGLLGLESIAESEPDPFAKKILFGAPGGLQAILGWSIIPLRMGESLIVLAIKQ